MTHAELVERLNLERATGLPRWHVHPAPPTDPEHGTAGAHLPTPTGGLT